MNKNNIEQTPRERLMMALKGGMPDGVPWAEMSIAKSLRTAYADRIAPGQTLEEFLGICNVFCGAICPPGICRFGRSEDGHQYIIDGLLKTREDLPKIAGAFPDPESDVLYEEVYQALKRAPKDLATTVVTDLGAGSAIQSMGVEGFSYALSDDPEFVGEVFRQFSQWSAKVLRRLCGMGFDFIWSGGDIAWKSAPFFSPEVFRRQILPSLRIAAKEITLPWVYHSDGNLMPILEDLLSLGMNALHPFEPGSMDIRAVKRQYGRRLCVVGNVDIDCLSRGSAEEIRTITRELIKDLGPQGGYIISSSNSLAHYVKTENVVAMGQTIRMNPVKA
ncbi:MAG: uroporphyrinogen decarboxylase family protein [Verrucomicrobiae bacterium]|nr:uroporphyrinogen decarboxylase family protein [Verrucomicrobiae bacterium]